MKYVSVQLVPLMQRAPARRVGAPRSADCAANLYRSVNQWDKSALDIKWSAKEKAFTVEFKGSGEVRLAMADALSKRIPLEIARASRYECGSTLELGDYSITIENADFRFHANYFCPTCKAKAVADQKGFRRLIERCFRGLTKIEIKATGVGIERQVERPSHAMEPTASRRTIQLHMSLTPQSAATRTFVRGGSSCFR